MKYAMEKHSRIYHFKNSDTLHISGVNLLDDRPDLDKIIVSNSKKRYVINLRQVNYTEVKA